MTAWRGVVMGVVLATAAPCTQATATGPADATNIVFAGIEVESRSVFVSSGGKILYPIGPETTAFVLATGGTSLSDVRKYRDGKLDASAIGAEARLFLGVERSFGQLFASLGIGPSLNTFQNRLALGERRVGIAAHGDLWYRPSDSDVFNATLIADSGPRSLWMRLRYGRKVAALPIVIGPELSLSHSVTTRKFRAGLHVSEWMIGRVAVTMAAGVVWDRSRPGQYFSASAYMKY